ncbi:MAG: GDYXXLXY domain-containing protein [Alphaproteobacteria bacterium]|nr:GDYXXLXY domain-containing protein [Alphaproteobacteria bacterium]
MKKSLFLIVSLAVFAIFNYGIYEKEQIKVHGQTVFLELAPVDPRSLMQGDYMRLRYAVERTTSSDINGPKKRGYMVIAPDDRGIARFVHFYGGESLQPGVRLLHYHEEYGGVRIVPDSFMFQEGQAELYRNAKYGEFKFDSAGHYILVGLADEKLQRIMPH